MLLGHLYKTSNLTLIDCFDLSFNKVITNFTIINTNYSQPTTLH